MGAGSSSGHYTPFSLAAALHPRSQVGNAIGRGNRHLFLTFLWLELGAILASTLLAVVRIHDGVTAAGKRVSSAAAICSFGGWSAACMRRALVCITHRLHPSHLPGSRAASTLLVCPHTYAASPLLLAPWLQGDHSLMLLGPVLFVVFDVFLLISVAALAIAQVRVLLFLKGCVAGQCC